MPTILIDCPMCGQAIEIDTTRAIVLTGTRETVWRMVKARFMVGEPINTQIVADAMFVHRITVARALRHLSDMGLVRRDLKRPGGTYHKYSLAAKHPSQLTRQMYDLAAM